MADYDLGTARGKITIDSSDAERGLATVAAGQSALVKSSGASSAALIGVGGAMTAVGVAGVAGFALAINSAANFEKSLSGVKAVSGATADEMEKVRKKALQLGADTVFSAGESALAMEELVKAGLTVEEVLNGAADATVALAAAGEIDLPQAATIAANAMNQFNLAAQDLPHVADLIAGAANASAIDVSQFGQSMQQAGATANLVGLSFDDLTLAIAAMGNAGIVGSDAGTSLKTFLGNLQPVTEKQISLFKELGLVTADGANQFFDAQGKIKSLTEISGVLSGALAGMTEQQKALTLETLFGSDAIRAAAIVANTGVTGFTELSTAINKTSAADVAATRMDNFKGSLEQLKGSFETLLITVGTPFLGFLRDLTDHLTILVNKFVDMDPAVQKFVVGIAAAATAFLTIAGSLITVIGFFKKFQAAFGALQLGKLLGPLLTNPIGLLIVAIIALVAAFILLWKNSETFREVVRDLIDRLQELGEWLQTNVLPVLLEIGRIIMDDVVPALVSFGKTVAELAIAFAGWFNKNIMPVITAFGELVGAVVQRVIQWVQLLKSIWDAIFPALALVVRVQLAIIQGVIQQAIGVIQAIWRAFGDNLLAAIRNAWNFIKGVIEAALQIIQGIIQVVTGIISGDWSKVWEGIQNIFGGVWDAILNIINFAMATLGNIIDIALSAIRLAWDILWETIKTVVQTALRVLHSIVGSALDGIIDFFVKLPGRILGALGSLVGLLVGAGKDLLQGLITGYTEIWKKILGFFGNLPDLIIDAIGDLSRLLFNIGKAVIGGLIDGIQAAMGGLGKALGGVGGFIVDHKGPEAKDKKLLVPTGGWIMEGLMAGIRTALPSLRTMLDGVTDVVAGTSFSASLAATTGTTGGGDTFNFNFPDGVTAADADVIKESLSGEVLAGITRAVRAGRRS